MIADTVFRPAVLGGKARGILMPQAIAQDGDGFLWEGGESGLARWDGYNFRLYVADASRPDGLSDHNVLALHQDSSGRLWVGTVTGGLARYEPATDRFTAVAVGDGAAAAQCIWGMEDDGAGGLWVASSSGLFHLDAAQRTVARFHAGGSGVSGLPLGKVEAVLLDSRGVLWVGGRGGLARGLDGNRRFAAVNLPTDMGAAPEVTHLVQDSAGRLWIGTREQGAYLIDGPDVIDGPDLIDGDGRTGAGEAVRVAGTGPASADTPAPEILAMTEVAPATVWLSTGGAGILEVTGAGPPRRHIRRDPYVPGSLAKNTVSALYRDRSGLVWVGTVAGLSRYDPANAGVLTLFGDAGRPHGLQADDASAVLTRPDGTLWVGSGDSGVRVIDPAGRRGRSLPLPLVFSMAALPDGPVYLGTRAGLYEADPAAAASVRAVAPGRPANAPVNALLASDGTLWLGGGEDGLWQLRPARKGVLKVQRHLAAPVLTNDTIYAVAPAPDGKLAVGTDKGFNLVDPASGSAEQILPDAGDPQGLGPGGIVCFAMDRQGRLWVGTDEAGIFVMLGRDAAGRPRFRHIGRAEGLPDLDIGKMLVDGDGRVWVSTDQGLAVVDAARFTARPLQAPQGVMITSYWANAGDTTRQGDLVFGGAGGLTIVRPGQVSAWHYDPAVAITGIKVGGVATQFSPAPDHDPGHDPDHGRDSGHELDFGRLQIPHDHDTLAVEFAALDLSAPELNRYSYRLVGFDDDWVETDAEHRVATYTNLPPGDYTLQLRGSNREGAWSPRTAELRITVQPGWYQTAWFRLAAGGAAVLAIGILVQGRTMLLRKRQHELERQVAERTAELRASQLEMQRFAYLDPLTGLPNRRAFNDEFDRLTSLSPPQPIALVLVDLDGFKKINDQLGHQAGDALLEVAAGRMRSMMRGRDFVARLGGDEFAILMRDVERREVVNALCNRLVTSMATPIALAGTLVTIGASAGAALYPVHGRNPDDLYRHADLALYDAKRTGRGTWRWFTEQPDAANEEKQAILF